MIAWWSNPSTQIEYFITNAITACVCWSAAAIILSVSWKCCDHAIFGNFPKVIQDIAKILIAFGIGNALYAISTLVTGFRHAAAIRNAILCVSIIWLTKRIRRHLMIFIEDLRRLRNHLQVELSRGGARLATADKFLAALDGVLQIHES